MKRNLSLFLLMLIVTGYVSAQPSSIEVEPGTKGTLPTLPTIAPAQEGQFTGFWFRSTGYTFTATSVRPYALFEFPPATDLGFDSYYLQYRPHGSNQEWEYWGNISGDVIGVNVFRGDVYDNTDFRLVNGDQVSNVQTVKFPAASNNYYGNTGYYESESGNPIKVVGEPIGYKFSLTSSSANGTTVDSDDDVFSYKWYRMNPNTWEMTLIEGASERAYTPTLADCGYHLVMEINYANDGAIQFRHDFGKIVLPVMASIVYVGNDGFVLNTDYVMSPDDFSLIEEDYGWGEQTAGDPDGPLPAGCVSQRKPGQYVFRVPREQYEYMCYDVAMPGAALTFVYEMDWGDGPFNWYREAQIMSDRYMAPLTVKPLLNGTPLTATVEVYAPNIDGELQLLESAEASGADGASFEMLPTLGGGCYVKALRTSATTETYYPSAQLWTEATAVVPGMDEEWNPISIDINVRSVPAALTGTGTIEGTVNVEATAARARRMAPASCAGISIYLRKKGGDIVAAEQTNATGSYRFEHVPMGSYEVLVNVDGCLQEQTTEVTLTTEKPMVSDLDFYVNEDNTITTTSGSQVPTAITLQTTATQQEWFDLSGRRLRQPQRGVNIVKGDDGAVRRILVR